MNSHTAQQTCPAAHIDTDPTEQAGQTNLNQRVPDPLGARIDALSVHMLLNGRFLVDLILE